MPRQSRTPLMPWAVSPAQLATLLQISPARVYEAIRRGEMRVFERGLARRVTVWEAIYWLENYWSQDAIKRKLKGGPNG